MNEFDFAPVMSNGLGVESVAILLRWLEEPATRDFRLEDLTVITAMTGEEWPDTQRDFEQHILPRFREYKVRFVQLARAGHSEKDGIVVLDDSRSSERLYIDGSYTLTEELLAAGTVPQFGGEHRCSLKFKAFVIETWLQEHLKQSIRHSFGYNADEKERIAKSQAAIAARVTFGFNSDETERVQKGKRYDRANRIGHYPLLEWDWNRQRCLDYIMRLTGIRWRKSACVFCPFAKLNEDLIRRQKEFPSQVAGSMLLERLSLAMNHRGQLYKEQPLYQIVDQSGNRQALDIFDARVNGMAWALYRVRRIYHPKPLYEGEGKNRRVTGHDHSKKGSVQRCVEKIEEFVSPTEAGKRLMEIAEAKSLPICRRHDLTYVFAQQSGTRYPTIEDYFVAAPALVETKARSGVDKFDRNWSDLTDLYCGHDDLPLFADLDKAD
jgi:hypothetical protein